ncbi:hypothetical protein TRAPUB_7423 [Trametes pubescens]|uniref:F-box domain-containing protein n=1 Tax=Trametes pubescens TaxID=154538 RepID=A0A1M2V3H1_TRAPU|nr:hypothetical protein TRAPUB_7423 [Trametes pubescens]
MRAFHKIEEVYAAGYYNGIMVPMPLVDSSGNRIIKTPPPPPFGLELDYLPNVRAVTFLMCPGGVPWYAFTKCLEYPNVTSISIDKDSAWLCTPSPPTPSDLSPTSLGCRLTEFIYTPCQWRETQSRLRKTNIQPAYAYEMSYLHALVLAMSDTAESLALPVETAPLSEMANKDWPRLHTLSLTGRYTHPDQCRAISLLLLRMPNLRSLSIKVMQSEEIRRPLLLKGLAETSFHLRSLTVAYPNPEDPIFSCIGDGLTSLSLRDSPRHYFALRYGYRYLPAIFPILSASECLAILKRVSAPRLTVLELVYQADSTEDELLQYLPKAFPLLQELELHRYKANLRDTIPYLHIAHTLMLNKYLRALYLNVDIKERAYRYGDPDADMGKARSKRGLELVRVLQRGTYFEYVALPLHTHSAGIWILFRPAWSPDRTVDRDSPYGM